jgi:putative transposase
VIFSLVLFAQRCINPLWQAIKRSLRQWTKPDNHSLALNAVLDITRSKTELVLENALLRQQLSVLQRQIQRPKLSWRDRALIVLLASKLRSWRQALVIVQPDTVLRWHRDLFRRVWKRKTKSNKEPGRPPLTDQVVALIKQMAEENHTWGAKRIRGELLKLGLRVSKSAIQKYIAQVRSSLPPKQNWSTFLRNHASQIWACDFLQTYDVFFRTVFVFVIIELSSRRVVHFGVTRHPTDRWIAQQLRNATPFGEGPRFLIRDNDRKYGPSFGRVAAGIDILRTPHRAPKANAICERFLGSLRRECLNHFLILGEEHLYRVVKEYTQYFNRARPHQGIEQRIPCRPQRSKTLTVNGTLASRSVLSGLHHDYYWRATQPIDQRGQPQAFLH